jgi:hypothetical protein
VKFPKRRHSPSKPPEKFRLLGLLFYAAPSQHGRAKENPQFKIPSSESYRLRDKL